jgi:acetoin utilization protein AcuB
MKTIPAIGTVMTPSPVSIGIDETVRVAEEMMIDNGIRHLPVTESGILVGLLSDRDIAFTSNSTEPDLTGRLRVRDVCSLRVYAVERDAPLELVLREMANRRIGSVVITENGSVAGLFTATDACRCFADLLGSQSSSKES